MPCDKCPCADICLQWDLFCGWAASDDADPSQLKHICGRSALGAAPARPAGSMPAAESIALTRRMNACPYRSRDAGCGCSGGRCSLRGGAVVSHLECFPCLERYP